MIDTNKMQIGKAWKILASYKERKENAQKNLCGEALDAAIARLEDEYDDAYCVVVSYNIWKSKYFHEGPLTFKINLTK